MDRKECVFLETYIKGIVPELKQEVECLEKDFDEVYLKNIKSIVDSALALLTFSVDENFEECVRRIVDGKKMGSEKDG